jgi:hypothetical protein
MNKPPYMELTENQAVSLRRVLERANNYGDQIDTELIKYLFIYRDKTKSLVIYLRNELNFSPVKIIMYLMVLHGITLSKANLLYNDNIPELNDTQTIFK